MSSHQENNTWTLAYLPDGKKEVKGRWFYRLKSEGDKKPYKASLVEKNYLQQLGFDYKEYICPCSKHSNFRKKLDFIYTLDFW